MAEKKPFEPTDQRKRKARREGKVLKSQHLTQSLVCAACLITILCLVRVYWLDSRMLLEYLWTRGLNNPILSLRIVLREVVFVCLGTLGVGALVGVLVDFLQVGLRFEWAVLSPRSDRMNPARFVSKVSGGVRSSWQVIVKALFVGVFLGNFVWQSIIHEGLPRMILNGGGQGVWEIWPIVLGAFTWGVALLVIVGVCDLFLKRREYLTELSMSHDEIRQESKDDEGDPLVRSMRRSLHEQLMMQDLVRRVRRAKVVVVEPSRS